MDNALAPDPTAEPTTPAPSAGPPLKRWRTQVNEFARSFLQNDQQKVVTLLAAVCLFAALGAAVGSFTWWSGHWKHLETHVTKNSLSAKVRASMLLFIVVGAVALPVVTGAWQVLRRGSVESWQRLAARLSPGIVCIFFPFIFDRPTWNQRELPALLMILCAGLTFEWTVRLSLEAGPCILPAQWATFVSKKIAQVAARRSLPLFIVIGVTIAYASFFSVYSTRIYYRLGSRAFDLGIENNLIWNASTFSAPLFKSSPLGGPTAVHTGYHQTFFSYIIAIPYRLWPDPRALLIFQSMMIGASAIPLFIWLRRRLDVWISGVVAVGYLLYPAVHGPNLFDFHYQPLGPVLIWTALLFLERGKWIPGIFFALLTWSLREDMTLMLAIMGGFLVLSRQQPVAGIIIGAVAMTVFVVQKLIIMPKFLHNGGEAFIHQYAGLLAPGDKGFSGVIKTAILNPAFTLKSLLEQGKLSYVLQIFVPLLFLPLRRAMGWWFCLPGFFFTLLSTDYWPLIWIGFQYSVYWSMFVFLAIGWTLSHMAPRKRLAALAGFALAMSATSWEFGAWLQPENGRGSWDYHRFKLTAEDHKKHEQAYALIEMIPKDAKVAASEFINPHVSSRANAYSMRGSLYDAEYLLLHLAAMGPREKQLVRTAVERDRYGLLAKRGKFLLFKKGFDTARNADVMPLLK